MCSEGWGSLTIVLSELRVPVALTCLTAMRVGLSGLINAKGYSAGSNIQSVWIKNVMERSSGRNSFIKQCLRLSLIKISAH